QQDRNDLGALFDRAAQAVDHTIRPLSGVLDDLLERHRAEQRERDDDQRERAPVCVPAVQLPQGIASEREQRNRERSEIAEARVREILVQRRDLVERQDRKQGRERSPAAARRASARRRCRAVERERRRNEQQHPGPPRPEIVLSGKTKPEEQRRQRWSVLERKREKCRENEYRRRENDDREPGTADAGRDTCCV